MNASALKTTLIFEPAVPNWWPVCPLSSLGAASETCDHKYQTITIQIRSTLYEHVGLVILYDATTRCGPAKFFVRVFGIRTTKPNDAAIGTILPSSYSELMSY